MLASFAHSAGTVEFTRGPLRPSNTLTIVQPTRITPGGVLFGFSHTITGQLMRLPLRMTTAQKDLFLIFFNEVVRGMSELFVYTDPQGRPVSARFADRTLSGLNERAYDAWEITVSLRVFGGQSYWPSSGYWFWPSNDRLVWPGGQPMGAY